jgi:nucleoside-diphosphate-sugar epimerase
MAPDLAGRRALVTGARGFIGRRLCGALAAHGAHVVATTRGPATAADAAGVEWRRCDFADADAARALVAAAAPDWVFHLGSLADGRRDRSLVLPTFHGETVAAVHVLEAVAAHGRARLLLPASIEEPAPGEAPASPYGAAKTATHLYARMYHRLYATPVVMARIYMAYGPGQPEWKLIPSVARQVMRGEAPVIESPDRLLDWVYIDDVVEALIATMLAPGVEGSVVDVGTGRLTPVRELVQALCGLIDPALSGRYGQGTARGDAHVRHADMAATRRATGWAPRITLEEGLRSTVAALRKDLEGAVSAARPGGVM